MGQGGTLPIAVVVVANCVEVEPHQVHGVDRWLVVEQCGDQRRSTDQVTSGRNDRVANAGFGLANVGG